jgi:hypothetical protein
MKLARYAVMIALVLVSPFVLADAPRDQYAPFAGDDPTVTDNFTQLTWLRQAISAQLWVNAPGACGAVKTPGPMRLPTLKELLTLVDENPHPVYLGATTGYKWIDQSAFPDMNTPVDKPYWTMTPAENAGPVVTKAFAVDLATGQIVTGVAQLGPTADKYNVICVSK